MNLAHLFDIQRELDQHIVEKHGLQNEDLLPKKILALQVELGELANEWRGFKFWSEDQEPRNFAKCWNCSGQGKGYFSGHKWSGDKEICIECSGTGVDKTKNPLLEEYVDCLHFILSIGLELGDTDIGNLRANKDSDLIFTFLDCNEALLILIEAFYDGAETDRLIAYIDLFEKFLGLGEQLGFTWDEVERAYLEKNKVNHERQESGY